MSNDHEVSNKVYVGVFFALMVGTAVTVLAAGVDMGRPVNIVLGLAIATVKASLVGMFFMHLKYETRLVVGVALSPIVLFLILIFALFPDVGFGTTLKKPYTAPHAPKPGH